MPQPTSAISASIPADSSNSCHVSVTIQRDNRRIVIARHVTASNDNSKQQQQQVNHTTHVDGKLLVSCGISDCGRYFSAVTADNYVYLGRTNLVPSAAASIYTSSNFADLGNNSPATWKRRQQQLLLQQQERTPRWIGRYSLSSEMLQNSSSNQSSPNNKTITNNSSVADKKAVPLVALFATKTALPIDEPVQIWICVTRGNFVFVLSVKDQQLPPFHQHEIPQQQQPQDGTGTDVVVDPVMSRLLEQQRNNKTMKQKTTTTTGWKTVKLDGDAAGSGLVLPTVPSRTASPLPTTASNTATAALSPQQKQEQQRVLARLGSPSNAGEADFFDPTASSDDDGGETRHAILFNKQQQQQTRNIAAASSSTRADAFTPTSSDGGDDFDTTASSATPIAVAGIHFRLEYCLELHLAHAWSLMAIRPTSSTGAESSSSSQQQQSAPPLFAIGVPRGVLVLSRRSWSVLDGGDSNSNNNSTNSSPTRNIVNSNKSSPLSIAHDTFYPWNDEQWRQRALFEEAGGGIADAAWRLCPVALPSLSLVAFPVVISQATPPPSAASAVTMHQQNQQQQLTPLQRARNGGAGGVVASPNNSSSNGGGGSNNNSVNNPTRFFCVGATDGSVSLIRVFEKLQTASALWTVPRAHTGAVHSVIVESFPDVSVSRGAASTGPGSVVCVSAGLDGGPVRVIWSDATNQHVEPKEKKSLLFGNSLTTATTTSAKQQQQQQQEDEQQAGEIDDSLDGASSTVSSLPGLKQQQQIATTTAIRAPATAKSPAPQTQRHLLLRCTTEASGDDEQATTQTLALINSNKTKSAAVEFTTVSQVGTVKWWRVALNVGGGGDDQQLQQQSTASSSLEAFTLAQWQDPESGLSVPSDTTAATLITTASNNNSRVNVICAGAGMNPRVVELNTEPVLDSSVVRAGLRHYFHQPKNGSGDATAARPRGASPLLQQRRQELLESRQQQQQQEEQESSATSPQNRTVIIQHSPHGARLRGAISNIPIWGDSNETLRDHERRMKEREERKEQQQQQDEDDEEQQQRYPPHVGHDSVVVSPDSIFFHSPFGGNSNNNQHQFQRQASNVSNSNSNNANGIQPRASTSTVTVRKATTTPKKKSQRIIIKPAAPNPLQGAFSSPSGTEILSAAAAASQQQQQQGQQPQSQLRHQTPPPPQVRDHRYAASTPTAFPSLSGTSAGVHARPSSPPPFSTNRKRPLPATMTGGGSNSNNTTPTRNSRRAVTPNASSAARRATADLVLGSGSPPASARVAERRAAHAHHSTVQLRDDVYVRALEGLSKFTQDGDAPMNQTPPRSAEKSLNADCNNINTTPQQQHQQQQSQTPHVISPIADFMSRRFTPRSSSLRRGVFSPNLPRVANLQQQQQQHRTVQPIVLHPPPKLNKDVDAETALAMRTQEVERLRAQLAEAELKHAAATQELQVQGQKQRQLAESAAKTATAESPTKKVKSKGCMG